MQRIKKKIVVLYGFVSLLIISAVIFTVYFSADKKYIDISDEKNLARTGESPNTSVLSSDSTGIVNNTDENHLSTNRIYSPYQEINFNSIKQNRTVVIKDKIIQTDDYSFKELFKSDYKYNSEGTESSESFLNNIKDTNYLFVLSVKSDKEIWINEYELIKENECVVAIELIGEGEEDNFKMWDKILSLTMPQMCVYGMNKNIITYVKDNKEESNIAAVKAGHYLNIGNISGEGKNIPVLKSITVVNNKISIEAENYVSIEWITENGNVCAWGAEIEPYDENIPQWNSASGDIYKPSKYLRAVIMGEEGTLYTQPFMLLE